MPFSAKAEEKIAGIKARVVVNAVRDNVLGCCAVEGFRRFPYDRTASEFVGATKPQKIEGVKRAVLQLEERTRVHTSCSMVMITLNSQQKITAKALQELGYICTGWAKRSEDYGRNANRVAVFVKQLYGVEEEKV